MAHQMVCGVEILDDLGLRLAYSECENLNDWKTVAAWMARKYGLDNAGSEDSRITQEHYSPSGDPPYGTWRVAFGAANTARPGAFTYERTYTVVLSRLS